MLIALPIDLPVQFRTEFRNPTRKELVEWILFTRMVLLIVPSKGGDTSTM